MSDKVWHSPWKKFNISTPISAIFRLSPTIFPTLKKSEKSRDEIGRVCVLVNDTDFKLTLKSTSLVSSFAKLIFIINVVILPGALQFTTPSLRKGHIFNINSISKVNANIIFRPKCQAPSPGYSLLLQTSYKENVYPDANMERGISFYRAQWLRVLKIKYNPHTHAPTVVIWW